MKKKSSRSAGSRPMRDASPPGWASELGAAIRKRRKLLRLTQKQLAELSNCGSDFLYDLERGKPTVQLGKLVAVLEALGMKLEVKREPRSGGLGASPHRGAWIEPVARK